MPLRRGAALLVALVLVAASCAKEADSPIGTGDPTTTTTATTLRPGGFSPEPIVWDDCGSVECATLAVPLDYADPRGDDTAAGY